MCKNLSLYFIERKVRGRLDGRIVYHEEHKPHTNHLIYSELNNWHFHFQKEIRKSLIDRHSWMPLESWQSEEIGTRIDPAMLKSEVLHTFVKEFE